MVELTQKIFGELTPWETVEIARHPDRPMTTDYIELVFDEFIELHGDRAFGDDEAIVTGMAKLERSQGDVHRPSKRARTLKERSLCNFGCAHPEGYRKALAQDAAGGQVRPAGDRLIDTPGAYPGIAAEERGQAAVIAENLMEMSATAIRRSSAS